MAQLSEKLAILIPTRNRPEILATTLRELQEAGFGGVPLWVYDDCSINAAAIRDVVGHWPTGKVIRGNVRTGQAQGRNVLMEACDKEFGLFIDDDSVPASALAVADILAKPFPEKRVIVTSQYLDVPTQRYSTRSEIGEGVARTFQGGGSLFNIPKVLRLGGFRKFFVYGYEEPELAMRIRMKGFEIWYDPTFLVRHNHFETPNEQRDYREYDYLYARNGVLMSSLNMPLWMGLPHGLARSIRRSFYLKRNGWAKLRGTTEGIWLTFARWKERTPSTAAATREYMRCSKEWVR
jgi:GT2 family glycosyltransferase